MIDRKNWHRSAALIAFVGVLSLAGCGKKDDAPKAGGDPKPVQPKEEKKDAPLTGDDEMRAIAKAAGGDWDKSTTIKDDTEELLKATPDAVLKEAEFAAGMKKDRAYLQQYEGKIVDIVGTLKHYDLSDLAGGEGPEFMLDSFQYKYHCRDPNAMARVAPGQTVTLRARCSTLLGFPRCVIVKVEGEPPEEIAADELAERYTADMGGTTKKYQGKEPSKNNFR